ncbi:unnamed protein product [Bathycoccus prasinos]
MSEPSFEAAVRTLEDMFPDLDPIVVRSVLDAKDGDMNETTTKLLAMSRSKRGGAEPSRGGGNGYGDAPRSESMGGGGLGGGIDVGGGEEINPYSRDARHSSVYNSQPPPDDDDNFWGWLTGEENGRRVPASSANYATGITEDDDTFNWLANQANYYAGELSRNVKSMTDAIAEELLGPAEDEEGDEIEEEDDSVRGDGHVVAGGATLNASRRGKVKEEKPKMKPKKKKTPRELEEEDDPLGGFLELLGLEDEEDEEYVRRDSKKDK